MKIFRLLEKRHYHGFKRFFQSAYVFRWTSGSEDLYCDTLVKILSYSYFPALLNVNISVILYQTLFPFFMER